MTANRVVLAAIMVGMAAGQVVAQRPSSTTSFGNRITPVQATTPDPMAPPMGMPPAGSPPMMPPPIGPQPMDTLMAPPSGIPTNYPPGTVFSPWAGGTHAGSPLALGRNGPIGYETYVQTGPSILVGNSTWTDSAKSGWMVGGGYKTLFFNTSHDAAWFIDLGVSYTRNDGDRFDKPPLLVTSSELKFGNVGDNSLTALGIRGISRTSFNFAIGRDWWLNGPGAVNGDESHNNWRFGTDVGGRWGSASIDFAPTSDPEGYSRRRSTLHGAYIGGYLGWERPFGNFTAFANFRTEWSYTWTDLIPPNNSDFIDVNIMMTFGIRF